MQGSGVVAANGWRKAYFHMGALPFWLVHLAAIVGVAMVGFSWFGLGLLFVTYYARMFLITGGYHRYFCHRAYKTSRFFQFVLAFLGATCLQKGALWWAGNHRQHHKFADTPEDPHSPREQGLLWAHMGWILSPQNNRTRVEAVRDLARYPELVWLNKYHLVPVVLYAVAMLWAFGAEGLVWGFLVSSVALWHGTFTINSLTHVFGTRRFENSDDSLNSLPLALLTMGEGWHNNHHYYQSTANQGFYWWEIDMSYYVLLGLEKLGIVWDLRKPPQWVLDKGLGKHVAEPSDGQAAREHPVEAGDAAASA